MKKKIIIGSIIVLAISFLLHSVYDMFPSFFTSIILPVNESIWEHGKLILTSFVIWTIIEKIFFKDNTNKVVSNFCASLTCIFLTDIIFGLVYFYILHMNDNIVVTIIIYSICILISFILKEKYYVKEYNKRNELFGILGFIVLYIIFGIYTYYPIEIPLFYDYKKAIYGIK